MQEYLQLINDFIRNTLDEGRVEIINEDNPEDIFVFAEPGIEEEQKVEETSEKI